MTQNNERGLQYSDNIIDNILSFNVSSTWTTVGTGSGSVDTNEFFEGSGSLKINNTDYKNTDLTVSNSVQSSIVPIDGNYDFSLYLKKTLAEDMSIDLQIFKGASQIYGESIDANQIITFSADDVDNWTSFITNESFSLSKGEVITFVVKLKKNASSSQTSVNLWLDGLMLYNKERNQIEAPIYTKSKNLLYNQYTGWGDYVDGAYTSGSPFSLSASTVTALPNNKATVIESHLPSDVTTFYDGTKITGREGDAILVTIDFIAKPTNVATTYIEVWVDITGGTGTPVNLANLYKRIVTFPKGNGVERPINFTFSAYTLDTWEANGGVVKVLANDTAELYNIRYVITRTHKAR